MANERQINIRIDKLEPTLLEGCDKILCDNGGYTVYFTFDSEWAGHDVKTALFVCGGNTFYSVFKGSICKVPEIDGGTQCYIGVVSGDIVEENAIPEKKTTTWATVKAVPTITSIAKEPQNPPNDVYVEFIALLNKYLEQDCEDCVPKLEALDEKTLTEGGIDEEAFKKLTRGFNRVYFERSWRDNDNDGKLETPRGLYPKMTTTYWGELDYLPRNYDEGQTDFILGSIPERLGNFLNEESYAGHILVRRDVPTKSIKDAQGRDYRDAIAAPIKYVDEGLEKKVSQISPLRELMPYFLLSRVDGYDSVIMQGNGRVFGIPLVYDYDTYTKDAIPLRRASDNTIRANTPANAGNRVLANVGFVKNYVSQALAGIKKAEGGSY